MIHTPKRDYYKVIADKRIVHLEFFDPDSELGRHRAHKRCVDAAEKHGPRARVVRWYGGALVTYDRERALRAAVAHP